MVNNTITSSQLYCGGFIGMANGLVSETVCLNDVIYQAGIGNAVDALPEIIDTDIKASNGIVHVVDQVLLPTKVGCKTISM